MRSANPLLLCLLVSIAGPVTGAEDTGPEAAIRQALATWTEQFNARDAEGVCTLFAPGLRYNVEGTSRPTRICAPGCIGR
jgi:hypothetical protein